jgi:hypothetical protein
MKVKLNYVCRPIVPDVCYVSTTTQAGGEKGIEYYQLKAATLAGECQEIFVAAVFAFDTGKPVVDVAAIQIPINHLLDVRSPESVLS